MAAFVRVTRRYGRLRRRSLMHKDPDRAPDLDDRHLVVGLENKIAARCKALEAEVLAEAQNRPVDEIVAMPRLGVTAPGPSDDR